MGARGTWRTGVFVFLHPPFLCQNHPPGDSEGWKLLGTGNRRYRREEPSVTQSRKNWALKICISYAVRYTEYRCKLRFKDGTLYILRLVRWLCWL
jgi:hypothetical protein